MRTALDTNILSALWSREPTATAVVASLASALIAGTLVISPVVYAELLTHPLLPAEGVRPFLDSAGIAIDFHLHDATWTEAGQRFARYAGTRRQQTGDGPRRLLADFVIGAHALFQADRLMTLDETHYRKHFPELQLQIVSV